MKYTININQSAIIENGFNVKGTTLDTWALLDFLVFFNSAKNHKTLNKQAIKKHLDLLEQIGLIDLIKDEANNVYYTLKNEVRSVIC